MKTAYPISSLPVTITLYANIPFDNTYKHHTIISTRFKYNDTAIYNANSQVGLPCERFINRKIPMTQVYYYSRWIKTGTYNFNYSNGLIGSIVLELTPQQTNANYMKVVSGNDIYYYFITAINQINDDTYTLSLELDVIMTYQDEFLSGISGKPVFTNRKHCHRYTDDGLMPYCADFKTGEDIFAGVKPSVIKQMHKLHFETTNMKALEGIMWLYVCCDVVEENTFFNNNFSPLYHCHNKAYPLSIVAFPINVNSVTYKHTDGTKIISFSADDIRMGVTKLIGKGDVHGAKISPYPPFESISNAQTITFENGDLVIASSGVSTSVDTTALKIYNMSIHGTDFLYGKLLSGDDPSASVFKLMLKYGGIVIQYQNDTTYSMEEITPTQLGFKNNNAPTIYRNRFQDPKLLFSPFKKYLLSSQYASNGWEFYPELIFSQYVTAENYHLFNFESSASSYIGDNNFYTRVFDTTTNAYNNYQYDKIGLMSAVNYIFPCGENALDVFNATQAQSFYTSKVASGITSGLTIAGGVASVALGAGMTAGSGGALSPMGMGMVTAGVGAIASGTSGIATNIKSAQAKVEDLKNTPDSFNVTGSNFITDESIAPLTNGLPYVLVYEVTNVVKKNADDYFYSFGYQVARDCFFNYELKVDNTTDEFIDNNLFGRTLFNYIQLNEDITNKITNDIPLIAKQKLSSIFNNGITIWNFFGFESLWQQNDVPSTILNLDNWFMKNVYDNTEYNN